MPMTDRYETTEPARAEVDAWRGAAVLEFGTPWCGVCRAAQPLIAQAIGERPELRHMKIEDGPRRPLGRSYRIKLWPTLVFLRDGVEVARVVRPDDAEEIRDALRQLGAGE